MSTERTASMLESHPIRAAAEHYDVAILGGGLAGLTLAIQLKKERPATTVVVLEKREGPAPEAAFKVGESTVPSGAHYFAKVVGMEDHLRERHLKKGGLRFFFPGGDNSDITRRPENGPPRWDPHDDYQIDRGVFENELAERARAAGADVLQGCHVGAVTLGEDLHTVEYTKLDNEASTRARWVVDAAGRANLLKRQLGLSVDVDHTINSAWFRLGGGLDLEQWGANDGDWMARMTEPGIRMRSTNHLLGEGYWVWMIPLGTGPISIGVCADPRFHPFREISELDRLLEWLRRHEPQLAAAVEPRLDDIEDFLRIEDFAYGVERTYSPDRWSLVGDAAAFADPFYSPGSDMIAYGNTWTCDLIVRELNGRDIEAPLQYYNDLYQRIFAHVLARTEEGYPVFGNPWVSVGKLAWGAYSNHAGIVPIFLNDKFADLDFMKTVDDELDRLFRLNINMQKLFSQWHRLEQRPLPPMFIPAFPALLEGIRGLVKEYTDDELRETVRRQVKTSEALAVVFVHRAARALSAPPPPDARINPYAVSLDPPRWDRDESIDGDGLTLNEANEIAPGAGALWPGE